MLLFTHCQWAFSFFSFIILSSRAITYCPLLSGVGVEVLAVGRGCSPDLYEESTELLCVETADSCQLLLDPLLDTDEALQPCVGLLGENLFRKVKMLLRSEEKSVGNNPVDPRKDWGGAAADNRTEISLQLLETHQWSRWFSAAS